MGGVGFAVSMVWAQIFPFVALQLYEGGVKEDMTMFLTVSLSLWLLLNIAFFCTIDLKFIGTFFTTKTAPQYACELYRSSESDFQKWDSIFTNRIEYSTMVHEEVKIWVSNSGSSSNPNGSKSS